MRDRRFPVPICERVREDGERCRFRAAFVICTDFEQLLVCGHHRRGYTWAVSWPISKPDHPSLRPA